MKVRNSKRGSMTIEAVLITIIVIMIIFWLLYIVFYSVDEVRMRSWFLYSTEEYKEYVQREKLNQLQTEEINNIEMEDYIVSHFTQGILVKKISYIKASQSITGVNYTANFKFISIYPIVKKLIDSNDNNLKLMVCYDKLNGCEVVRMYQALAIRE